MTKNQIEIPGKYVVELTGSINSGKSLAGDTFRRLGVPVEDADQINRDIKAPGQPAYDDIAAEWPQVIRADDTIDNALLGSLTIGAGDRDATRQLEAFTHPRIKKETVKRLSKASGLYVVYERPALLKAPDIRPNHRLGILRPMFLQDQIASIIARGAANGREIEPETAIEMIRRQHGPVGVTAVSDTVIYNDASPNRLVQKVQYWHERKTRELTAKQKPALLG